MTRSEFGRGRIVALALFALSGAPRPDCVAQSTAGSFAVVAYLPDYRVDAIDLARTARVTDVVYFSIEPKPSGELDLRRAPAQAIAKLRQAKQRHHTRLLVAVGGWDRSSGFKAVVSNPRARARFVANLSEFCQRYGLDGIDFDWEHPQTRQEEQAYGSLLAEVKRAFAPRGWLVTVAGAAWQNLDKGVLAAVDRVHVMAYDHGEGPHHSSFEQAQADLERLMKRGAPRAKICLGLPFYGRGTTDRRAEVSYAEIVQKYRPAPDANLAGEFSFNGLATVQRKTRFALEQGLGGVMIWELGHDTSDPTSLLDAIRQVTK
jgi:GH18 family chitinase